MNMKVELIVFDGPATEHGPGLKLVANRYTPRQSESEGLTLLFTHCIGAHKELWEPVISRVCQLQQAKDKRHRIREAYSFDWQNHGDAALLNEQLIKSRTNAISAFEWASAIAAFLKSNHFEERRTVAIGHSAGAGAFMCSTAEFPTNKPPYIGILLVEPAIVSKELYTDNIDAHDFATDMAIKATNARRDTWDSRDNAFQWLSKSPPWKFWDPRALRLYADHGLHTIQTPEGSAVTLKCLKSQEAHSYPHVEPHIEAARLFSTVCKNTPIHIIWGSRNDFNPVYIQESLSDESEGRRAASVVKVEGAGHMIVQEKPDPLSDAICVALDAIDSKPSSKL